MEVLTFQIGVFLINFLVGAFGTKPRLIVSVLIGIFTLIAVFTTWLAILQFFTIVIAFSISQNFANPDSDDGSYNFAGCLKIIFIIISISIIISFLTNKCNSSNNSPKEEIISPPSRV